MAHTPCTWRCSPRMIQDPLFFPWNVPRNGRRAALPFRPKNFKRETFFFSFCFVCLQSPSRIDFFLEIPMARTFFLATRAIKRFFFYLCASDLIFSVVFFFRWQLFSSFARRVRGSAPFSSFPRQLPAVSPRPLGLSFSLKLGNPLLPLFRGPGVGALFLFTVPRFVSEVMRRDCLHPNGPGTILVRSQLAATALFSFSFSTFFLHVKKGSGTFPRNSRYVPLRQIFSNPNYVPFSGYILGQSSCWIL